MTMRGMGLGGAMLAAWMLAGCAPPQPPKLDVEKQWGDAIGNLGLFPIYPPSEDVMVGDAFLYLPDAQFFNLVRVTAAPLAMLARQFCYQEKDRMVLDTLKDAKDGRVPAAHDDCLPPPVAGKPQEIPQRIAAHDAEAKATHATRLREAAIPRLEVGRFSEGELAGAGLLGNFGAALGIGTSASAALSVELGNLQGLTLDELRGSRLLEGIAVGRVREVRREGRDFPNSLTPMMLIRSLRLADHRGGTRLGETFCRGGFAELDENGARLVVANRVLYAGKVTFEFLNERVTAARFALDFAGAIAGLPQPTATPGLPAAPAIAPPAAPPAGANPLDVQKAQMLATANRIMSLGADGPAKVSARMTTGSFGRLALEKDFHRPAAVGMGAALHFPLWEAAVPASAEQVQEALGYCRESYGLDDKALLAVGNRLWRNYAWAFYLHRRVAERQPQRSGSDPLKAWAEAQEEIGNHLTRDMARAAVAEAKDVARGGRLKPLPANAPVRVRP